jgi:hypothetical protein
VGKKAPRIIYKGGGEKKKNSFWPSGSRFGNMQPLCMDSVITEYTSAMDKLAPWF